ncbi:MAG: ATP-binding protein [Thermomicrobiales bacterium]
MDSPVDLDTSRLMLDARRAFQNRFPIIPAAHSLDGRRFTFHAPIGIDLEPGRYVRLDLQDGAALLGQVLETEIEQLESTEVRVDNANEQGISLPGLAFGDALLRLRRNGLRGGGVILGHLDPASTAAIRAFDDAGITAATVEQVTAHFDAWTAAHPMMTIGSVSFPDGTMPAQIDPAGFNRHTFLCGQSGSGKTYSLGVVLEQLLLNTDLRMVILDPNADFVRLNEVVGGDAADPAGTRYADRVRDLLVYRTGPVRDDEHPLRIQFSSLPPDDQAKALQVDPLADREEFHTLRTLLRSFGDRPYDLDDIRHAASETLTETARAVTLRIANLGVGDWSVWAEPGESSLADLLATPWRSVVLDVSRFARPIERSVVALAMLRSFWAQRERRNPVLIVIDEAHNICPAVPEDAIQKAATDLMTTIAGEGRKYGIYLLVSTQRPDKLHPNVLSQCDNLMLMRMNSQTDLDDLATIFSFVPKGMLDRAATFRQGEALFAGKIVPAPRLLRIGKRLSAEGGADVPTTWATSSS